ncbi:MAG: aminoglycoside phosphotransferase family protein [Alphaproteobacteria bacterium]|nr:aminoglycoside phosphotransferase family protein [Alphaproteobacteria bacterium]
MIKKELDIIEKLIGGGRNIVLNEMGYHSRAYIVDGGELVFKFPRTAGVKYENEARVLEAVNTIDTDIKFQSVDCVDNKGKYLALYGVVGEPMFKLDLAPEEKQMIGTRLGRFLGQLHTLLVPGVPVYTVEWEIAEWQKRYRSCKDLINLHLTKEQARQLDNLMMKKMPEVLIALGEDRVFSHGDLGGHNIIFDGKNVGVIDFTESGYLDRAADFMDIGDTAVRPMLEAYNADESLLRKVAMRRMIKPVLLLWVCKLRNDKDGIARAIEKIKAAL